MHAENTVLCVNSSQTCQTFDKIFFALNQVEIPEHVKGFLMMIKCSAKYDPNDCYVFVVILVVTKGGCVVEISEYILW